MSPRPKHEDEEQCSVDARILMMRKGSRRSQKEVLEWQTGASRYGQDIKGMPVESVVLVRSCEVSGDGPSKARYIFSVKELKVAATR